MLILGIETSCDDTAAALLEVKNGRLVVRKNMVAGQAQLHQKYGGVVPEVAARKHLETIIPVVREVMNVLPYPLPTSPLVRGRVFRHPPLVRGRVGVGSPDAIAVTAGPGLITSLLVGVETAKALSYAWGVPLVGVNHIEGHIYSPLLSEEGVRGGVRGFRFPAIALIVSGGHTELILMKNHGQYRLLGRTRDDAAGECFDKAAAMLGLPYPGGPEISRRAEKGNPKAFDLPRPMLKDGFEFSFSGLKNAIRLTVSPPLRGGVRGGVRELRESSQFPQTPTLPSPWKGEGILNDLCASIEQAIVDVLVHKSLAAATKHQPQTFILAGGVAANKKLRATLKRELPPAVRFLTPAPKYCMDNAAMIAAAGYFHAREKKFVRYDKLKAEANWELV